MVTLNLRDDCIFRTGTSFRRGMTDKRFLELEITAWLASRERQRQIAGEAYYDGDQAAAHRKRIALDDDGKPVVLEHLPNNCLINNQYSKMVDQKTNYSFGRPFSLDTENKAYAAALAAVLGARFRRCLRNVGEGAWIGGKAWLYPYYEGGELAFKRLPADEVLPFWADADHTILDAAVHVYAVQEYNETEQTKMVVKVEVMHGGGVDCFIRKDDGTLEPDPDVNSGPYITEVEQATGKVTPYNWERIPLICFKSSHHELPLLSRVKCLQDAYTGYDEWYDGKGIRLSRSDSFSGREYDTATLNWNQVQKRIRGLIDSGRYLNRMEKDAIPRYEKMQLARKIYGFQYDNPNDPNRTYPHAWDMKAAERDILPLLDDAEKSAALYADMVKVIAGVSPDDRAYTRMESALQDMGAFIRGEYSLFILITNKNL